MEKVMLPLSEYYETVSNLFAANAIFVGLPSLPWNYLTMAHDQSITL